MNKKLTSTLTGAFVFIVGINVLSRGLGFFREILFANYFGLGKDFDIYLIGAVLPLIINSIVIYLGVNYYIPVFNKVKSEGKDSVKDFFKFTLFVFTGAGIVLSVVLFFSAGFLFKFYLHTSDLYLLEKTVNIFRIFLITIPLSCAISIFTAYQQAEYNFKYPAVARLFLNITIIPILFLFSGKFGIYAIPIGFVSGTLLQLIYLVLKSKIKLFKPEGEASDKKKLLKYLFDFSIVGILLIETIGQIYILSDRYFFDRVNPGGISALNYAMNLYMLPISIISFAITTVTFPKLSEFIQKGEFRKIQKNIDDTIIFNLIVFVPIAFVLFFYGDVLLKLFFERGKFESADTQTTFLVLKSYVISIIFYSSYAIANKIMYSARLIKKLLLITISGLVLKVFLNFILVDNYSQNGLAIATSLSYIFFFITAFLVLQFKLPLDVMKIFIKNFIFMCLNGIISYLITEQLLSGIQFGGVEKLVNIILFVVIFFLNIKLVKHHSFELIKQSFKSI